jgi:predicted metal-dependent hydrolase
MAYKEFLLDDLSVKIYKRKTARSIRLTIDAGGQVKVSIPIWVPYQTGLQFVKSKQEWIKHNSSKADILVNGQKVGKAHHLTFIQEVGIKVPRSRVSSIRIMVFLPPMMDESSEEAQLAATKACIRALKKEAERLLPQRLDTLALKHGFTYQSLTIKQMRSRWGSCDQHKNIVLNLFLMQLPWEHIDYVLIHELTHTKILMHGPVFWNEMERFLPNLQNIRKQMKSYQPILNGLKESI